ncbi:MAG: pseudouridine synthase [Candidatus Ozemobacteraceae bacterium]
MPDRQSQRHDFPILYQDEWYVAVHKPAGLLVHRSSMAPAYQKALLPDLSEQLGKRVFPIHRLDRGTSGVLVLAFSSEAAAKLSMQFEARTVQKIYLTILRGWLNPAEGFIDRPLRPLPGEPPRPALTRYRTLGVHELPVPVPPHQTSRYSLVEVFPETGRRQQIRRHFAGLSHPVIGDGSHGDKKHNQIFHEHFQSDRLLLMALSIRFRHPWLEKNLTIICPPDGPTQNLIDRLFPNVCALLMTE